MTRNECAARPGPGIVNVAHCIAILLGVLLAEPVAAQARPAPQPGDTVELRTGATTRSVRVAVVAVADGRADVMEAGRYFAMFSALPLDTLVIGGLRIGPALVSEMVVRAPSANVPLEWLVVPSRGRRLPSLPLLVGAAAWGGAMGATAGLLCDCEAVGRGAARGAVAFTAVAVVLGGRR
jgi:hypothetical protein